MKRPGRALGFYLSIPVIIVRRVLHINNRSKNIFLQWSFLKTVAEKYPIIIPGRVSKFSLPFSFKFSWKLEGI